jgi:multidrug efflux pump subunit AcrA (membrane-fusion protein)
MAGKSKWDYLKPEIEGLFKQGKTPLDVRKMYPDLPKATVYDWYKAWRNSSESKTESQTNSEIQSGITQKSLDASASNLDTSANLVAFEGAVKQSDFELVRRSLRDVLRRPDQRGAYVKVQAALALLKTVAVRAEVPKQILEESEETASLEDEIRKVQQEDPMQLVREFRQIIDSEAV